MAISIFDTATDDTGGTAATSLTLSGANALDAGTSADAVIVVTSLKTGGGAEHTGITWNGESLTERVSIVAWDQSVWSATTTSTGSANVVISIDSTEHIQGGAYSIEGADTTTSSSHVGDSCTINNVSSDPVTCNTSSTVAGSVLVDAFYRGSTDALVALDSEHTLLVNDTFHTTVRGIHSYDPSVDGNDTVTHDMTTAQGTGYVSLEILEGAGGGGPTFTAKGTWWM